MIIFCSISHWVSQPISHWWVPQPRCYHVCRGATMSTKSHVHRGSRFSQVWQSVTSLSPATLSLALPRHLQLLCLRTTYDTICLFLMSEIFLFTQLEILLLIQIDDRRDQRLGWQTVEGGETDWTSRLASSRYVLSPVSSVPIKHICCKMLQLTTRAHILSVLLHSLYL